MKKICHLIRSSTFLFPINVRLIHQVLTRNVVDYFQVEDEADELSKSEFQKMEDELENKTK